MSDQTKTKAQLIDELEELRQRVVLLEKEATGHWRKEKALEKQNRELQLILDSVPAYIFYKDKDGRIIRGNAAVARSAGMPREKWEGKTAFDLLSGIAERYQKDDMEVIATGEPKKGIVEPFETRKGTRWLRTHKLPVKDDNGDVTGLIGFSIDITEHIKAADALRRSEEKLRAVFDSIEEAITVTDIEGNIIDANLAAIRNSGFRSKKGIIGKNGLEFVAEKDRAQCARDIKHMAETGQGKTVEYTFVDRRGREYEGWASASLLRDNQGNPAGYVVIAKDTTGQRRMEEALRKSEENYRVLAENMKDVLYSTDAEGRITYLGPQAMDYDIDPQEAISRNMLDFVYPDDRERVIQDFQRTMSTGDEFPTEFRTTDSKGNIYWIEESGRLLRDEGGEVIGVTGVLRDVTERKRLEAELKHYGEKLEKKVEARTAELAAANRKLRQENVWRERVEKALRESEEMLRTMFESMVEGVLVCDLSGNILKANEAALRMAKVKRKALIGRNIFEFIAEEDRSRAAQDLTVTLAAGITKATLEYVFLNGEGERIDAEFSAALLHDSAGKPAGIIGIARDVTERKRMEQSMKDSEARFRELFNHMNSGVVVYEAAKDGKDFIFKDCNAAAEKISRLRKRDYIGKSVLKKMPSLKDFGLFEVLQTVWRTGEPVHFPVSYYTDERVAGWRDNYVYRLPSGEVVAVYDDVTDRIEAERALRESEEKLRTMFETIGDAFVTVDLEGNIMEVNEATVYISGYSKKELVGHNFMEFVAKKDQDSMLADMKATLESGISPKNLQYSLTAADGRKIDIEFNVSVLRDSAGDPSGFVAVIRDVSERRRMEEALRESEEERRIVFESIEDAITVTDTSGRIVDLNRAAIKTFGVGSKKKALGMEGFNFIAEKDRQRAMEDMVRLLTGKWRGPDEYTFETLDGREFIAESNNAVLRDASGEVMGFVSINRDITERKRMEQALRDSEEKLRIIFDSISDGIAVTDLNINIVQANEAVTRMAGYQNKEQLLGKNALEWLAPEDVEKAMVPMAEAIKGQPIQREEFRIRPPQGAEFFGEIGISPVRDGAGNMTGFVTVIRDVTERKHMEESLRASEEKLRTIFETIPDGITITDMEGRIVEENAAAIRMSGYSRKEDVIGLNGFDFIVEEDRERAIEDMSVLYETGLGVPGEYRMRTADGLEYYAEIIAAMMRDTDGKPSGIVAVIRDTTERRRVQEMLRHSEAKYRLLVDQMQEGYLIVRGQHIVFANERCADFLGIPVDRIVGQSIWDFVLPEDVHKAESMAESFMAAKEALHLMEFGYYREDGRMVPLEINMKGIEYEGKPALSVVLRDITERKQMENELRDSEKKLRTMFDMMRDGVVLTDTRGKIVDVNEAIVRIGRHNGKEDLIGRDGFELVAGEDRDRLLQAVADSLSGKTTTDRWEARFARGDGGYFDAELSGSMIRDSQGDPQAFIGVIRDITERRRMEEALRASEEKLRFMFKSIIDAVVVVDLEGSILEVNDAALRLTGYSDRDDLAGRSAFEFIAEEDRDRALNDMLKSFEVGPGFEVQYRFKNKQGDLSYVEARGGMLYAASGDVTGHIVIVRDITERRRMEDSLRASEEKLRFMFAAIIDAVVVIDLEGKILDINDAGLKMTGYGTRDEIIGHYAFEFIAEEDRERAVSDMARSFEEGPGFMVQYAMVDRSGGKRDVEAAGSMLYDSDGNVSGFINVVRDISERKRMEEELRASEEKLRAIFESIADAIIVIGMDGLIQDANAEAVRMLGHRHKDEVIGTRSWEYLLTSDRGRSREYAEQMFGEGFGGAIEFRLKDPDGKDIIVDSRGTVLHDSDGKPIGLVGVSRDITERRRMEEELRASEEKLRFMFESIADGILSVDLEGRITEVNESIVRMGGFDSKDEMIGLNAFDFVAERDRERAIEENLRNVTEGRGSMVRYAAVGKGGKEFMAESVGSMLRDSEGNPIGFITVVRDVTERQRMEEELQRIRIAVEGAGDAIGMSDPEGRHFYQNRAFTELFEYTVEELQAAGGGPVAYVDKGVAREVFDTIMGGGSWSGEVEMVSKSGRRFPVLLRADAIKDDAGHIIGLVGMHTDISERKRAEAALRESEEKLRTIFETSPDFIMSIARDGTLLLINRTVPEMTMEQAVGSCAYDYIMPEARDEFAAAIERVFGSGKTIRIETSGLGPDGRTSYYETRIAPVMHEGEVLSVTAVATDITERRRAQEALRESEERYRTLVEGAGTPITTFDADGNIIVINETSANYFGGKAKDFVGKSFHSLFPDAADALLERNRRIIETGVSEEHEDFLTLPAGNRWFLSNLQPVAHANGEVYAVQVISYDITDRKNMERTLRESEEKLRFMFESMGDAIVVVDMEGRITELNDQLLAMSGYESREEVMGMNAFDFVAPKDRTEAMETFARNMERQISATIEYVAVDRYGREFDVEANGAMLRDAEGNTVGFIIALRDISERKMMEQKLRDSEEMARGMLESAAAGIYLVQNGSFEYVSPQFEAISGYEAAELLGTEALSYVHPDDRESVRQKAIEGLKGKSSLPYEFRFVRKDGSFVWVLEKVASIEYKGKRATIASIMDITERKRAEQELVSSEEKLRSFMDSATDYFTIWDSELRLVDLNAAAMKYPVVEMPDGWDKEQFIGKSMAHLDPCTIETGRYDQYLQVIKTGKPFFAEDIIPHTKLGDIHMAVSAFKVGDGLGIITSDVTERRRAEKELRERKDELERRTNQLLALQKVTASIQSTLELDEVLQQVAEGVVDNLGYDQSLVLVVDEKADVYRARAWYSKDRVKYREGVEKLLSLALTDVKFPRKRGYSKGLDESMDGRVVITPSFSAVAVPPLDKKKAGAIQEFLGARAIVSMPLFAMERHVGGIIAFTHKDDVAETDVEPLKLLADQAGVAIVNANIYEGAAELAQRLAVTGTLSRILGSSLDINEVYQAFTEEISNVIDFERASISLVEGDHLRVHVLAPVEERTAGEGLLVPLAGSVTETIIRRKQTDIEPDLSSEWKSPMDVPYAEEGLRSVIRVPLLSKGEVFGSFELVSRKPGAYGEREQGILEQVAGSMAAAVENSRLFTQVKQHEAELIKAYEELKAAQDYMLQVEKLRALGEMASGVAHDFNNVLAIVLGRAQLALEDVKDAKLKKDLQIIEQAALDAASTVRRLQDFSRVRVDRTFEPVDLNKVVEGTLQMVDSRRIELKETQGISIDVVTDLEKLPTILGNVSELREALVNIVFNAMDAMPKGGTITVKSAMEERWAVLSVSDNGVGIPEEVIGKIFDPFFTTRAPKGSGLGLSVTYGIITRHGGKIDVESTPGKGSTFNIRLPAAGAAVGEQPPGKVSASVKPVHILLVDDDPEVGEVLGLMLRQMGHKVTGVGSGGAAVKAFESGGYDLVITDLGIPDMSGHEVAAAVKRVSPRTPVVMITGWGVQLDLKEMPEIDGLVAKPFSKQALIETISKLLQSKPRKGNGRKKKKGPPA